MVLSNFKSNFSVYYTLFITVSTFNLVTSLLNILKFNLGCSCNGCSKVSSGYFTLRVTVKVDIVPYGGVGGRIVYRILRFSFRRGLPYYLSFRYSAAPIRSVVNLIATQFRGYRKIVP